jgi:hypothetical protein
MHEVVTILRAVTLGPLSLSPGTRPKQTSTFFAGLWRSAQGTKPLPGAPRLPLSPAPVAASQTDHHSWRSTVAGRPALYTRPPLPDPKPKPGDWVPYPPLINVWSGPQPQKLLIPGLTATSVYPLKKRYTLPTACSRFD